MPRGAGAKPDHDKRGFGAQVAVGERLTERRAGLLAAFLRLARALICARKLRPL